MKSALLGMPARAFELYFSQAEPGMERPFWSRLEIRKFLFLSAIRTFLRRLD
jgi:hypothetical protein